MEPIVKEDLCQVGKWREVGVSGWAELVAREELGKGRRLKKAAPA